VNYGKNKIRSILLALTLGCALLVGIIWRVSRPPAAYNLAGGQADRILVQKKAHLLTLFSDGQPIKTYRIALGRGGLGQKFQAGDNKVPEGVYRIVGRNPHSAFHLALRVGYPTPEQVGQAHQRGVDPGGDIMIHGIRNGLGWIGPLQREVDWTKGCIAVTDREIEEIWHLVPDQTVIEIRP
jgi:murein L,D-transpeptidase YafK